MPSDIKKYRTSSFTPTGFEAVFYTIVGVIILTLYSYPHILSFYGVNGFEVTLPEQMQSWQAYIDARILPSFFTALVWGFTGFLAYMGIWIAMDTIFRAKDANPLVNHYVFSTIEQKHYFKTTLIGQIYLRFLAIGLLVGWLVILFKIMPTLSLFYYVLLTDPSLDTTLLASLGAIFLSGVYVYLGAPIARLIFLRPRIFSD